MLKGLSTEKRYSVYSAAAIAGSLLLYGLGTHIYHAITRSKHAYLKKMDINKPLSQWLIVHGEIKGVVSSYIETLRKDGLRVCLIANSEQDVNKLEFKPDTVLKANDVEEIKRFLEYRHAKILLNALPLSLLIADAKDDDAWAHLRNFLSLIEILAANMEKHGGGCIITLKLKEDTTPMQVAVGAHSEWYAKSICVGKEKKRLFAQCVKVPKKGLLEPMSSLAQKSMNNIGVYEKVN